MRNLAFVEVVFAACLLTSGRTAAAEPGMPDLKLHAHHGEMYAGHVYIDVDVQGTYYADTGKLNPGVYIDMRFPQSCTEVGCGYSSVSRTYNDITPLVETLHGAQPHFVDGTPYTHAFKSDPQSRDFMDGTAVIDPVTKRLLVKFGRDEEVTFDADEVAYFLGMLGTAQAQLAQIRVQLDAFNAARAFLKPPPPSVADVNDARLQRMPDDVRRLVDKMAACVRYADVVNTLPDRKEEALTAMKRIDCFALTADIAGARVRYAGNRDVEFVLGAAARQ